MDADVAIIGAGAAGLYAGMILQSLGKTFRIYEVSDRVGGRIHTKQVRREQGVDNDSYSYFDVGAMRFPDTDVMKRLFDLVRRNDLFGPDGRLLRDKLVEYHFAAKNLNSNEGGIYYFHGVRYRENVPLTETQVDDLARGFKVHRAFIKLGHKALYHDIVDTFVAKLRKDLAINSRDGWADLMDYDNWSTRSYLSNAYLPSNDIRHKLLGYGYVIPVGRGLATNVVDWLETMLGAAGFYDAGLADMVMGAIAFGSRTTEEEIALPDDKPKFYCFDGGSEALTQAMQHHLITRSHDCFLLGHRVTAIALVEDGNIMEVRSVQSTGKLVTNKYTHVISTVPITCLRYSIDLSDCRLSDTQKNAIRQLQYTTAVKIGVKFRTAWWTTNDAIDIVGGQSFTDLPIRTVVYPSYGIYNENGMDLGADDPAAVEAAKKSVLKRAEQPAVLIASYVRTNDAATLGGLIPPDPGPEGPAKDELKDLVLKDLAKVHGVALQTLKDEYQNLYAYDFAENSRSMGAFAAFGPGKFGELYESLTVPAANGRLHFAGEAVSIRHGWVVGALDSAWRSVCEYILQLPDANQGRLRQFLAEWGVAKIWASQVLDEKNAHLPCFNQEYITPVKKAVLRDAALAATTADAQRAVAALDAARARAVAERDATREAAVVSARRMAALARDRVDGALKVWRLGPDGATGKLVLSEAALAGALMGWLQATDSRAQLEPGADQGPGIDGLDGGRVGAWAAAAAVAAGSAADDALFQRMKAARAVPR